MLLCGRCEAAFARILVLAQAAKRHEAFLEALSSFLPQQILTP